MHRSTIPICLLLFACGSTADTHPDAGDPDRPDATVADAPPSDTMPPTVVSTSPADGAIGVDPAAPISISFDEPIDEATLDAALSATPAITCTIAWTGTTAVCTHPPLAFSTGYGVTVGAGVTDVAGNALATPHAWSFQTGDAPDTTPPAFVTSAPISGAIGVPPTAGLRIEFSEPMNPTATQAAVTIGGAAPTGTFAWSDGGRDLTFSPAAPYAYGDVVSWNVSTAATDVAGNPLPAAATGTFRIVRRTTYVATSAPVLDGYLREIGSTITVVNGVTYTNAGDRIDNGNVKTYLSFALPHWGADHEIISASLGVYQQNVIGTPYAVLGGPLVVEGLPYGAALDATDEMVTPVGTAVTLSTDPALGARTADVTAITQALWADAAANSYRIQVRVRFPLETDLNGTYDYVEMTAGEAATNRPTLTVTVQYP